MLVEGAPEGVYPHFLNASYVLAGSQLDLIGDLDKCDCNNITEDLDQPVF